MEGVDKNAYEHPVPFAQVLRFMPHLWFELLEVPFTNKSLYSFLKTWMDLLKEVSDSEMLLQIFAFESDLVASVLEVIRPILPCLAFEKLNETKNSLPSGDC